MSYPANKNQNGEQTITLNDGRKLGYMKYGDPNGFPILAFHGTPGSRIWFFDNDQTSISLGINLITIDRPGYGLSDRLPNRTVLDFAGDIMEFANKMQLEQFSVLGVSGGGVYSAACAYQLPDRIVRAGLISTIKEFKNGKPPKEMIWSNRISFILSRKFPWIIKWNFRQQKKLIEKNPEAYTRSIQRNIKHLCKADQKLMSEEQNAELLRLHLKEAFRRGVSEVVYELTLLSQKWGFEYDKIRTPIELWHGTEDTLAPIAPIKEMAELIPNCNSHYINGQGHFLADNNMYWEKILKSLLK